MVSLDILPEVQFGTIGKTKDYRSKKYNYKVSKSTCISARDVGVLLGISPFQSRLDLLFEKCHYRKQKEFTSAMKRGVMLEDEARRKYAEEYGIIGIQMPGFTRHPKYEFVGGVPDGIHDDYLIEIKCPVRFSCGLKPSEFYNAQMQIYMHIFNLRKGRYVEYVDGQLRVIEIERDDIWWNWVLPLIKCFWEEVCYWREHGVHNHKLFTGCTSYDCNVCAENEKNKKMII